LVELRRRGKRTGSLNAARGASNDHLLSLAHEREDNELSNEVMMDETTGYACVVLHVDLDCFYAAVNHYFLPCFCEFSLHGARNLCSFVIVGERASGSSRTPGISFPQELLERNM
jgi:hypothetical protein